MAFTWTIDDRYRDVIINKSGKLAKIVGVEEVRQRVIIALRHYWQEYFLNVPSGMPWYELVLGSQDLKQAELLIRDTILNVPGVVSIMDITPVTMVERDLSLNIRIEAAGIEGVSIEEISFSIKIGS